MFVDFGVVRLLLLTALVFARPQVARVPLSEDEISRSEGRFDRSHQNDGGYQNINNNAAGMEDNHPNTKLRKIPSLSQDQNPAPGANSDKNYKSYGTVLGSSSDHRNEAALGDGYFEFTMQDKELFENEGALPLDTDLNQAEFDEILPKREEQGPNKPPMATGDAGGVVRKGGHFNLEFNYTIDVSDMSLACQDGRVNITTKANQLVLALNEVLRMFQELREKYANWAYNTSWAGYSHLIREHLGAHYVPLLPLLPEDFNHSVIKSKKPTTQSPSPPIEPGQDSVTSRDAETSLDKVLRDIYSAMELCRAAADPVLLDQVLSSYPLIRELTELYEALDRVRHILWKVLDICNVDPNPEPLQYILKSTIYARENVDDIKRRGFLTIFHTERALEYVKHIFKEIDSSLKNIQ